MATDTAPPPAPLTLVPSPAVVNALLAWPTEEKLALARVLEESVADPAAERERNRALIHARLAELTSGTAKFVEPEDVFAAMRAAAAEARGV